MKTGGPGHFNALQNPTIAAVSAGEASNISAGWLLLKQLLLDDPAKALEAVGVIVCASNETFEVF